MGGLVLAALAILLLYGLLCAGAWVAPHFAAMRDYYWLARGAVVPLYWAALGEHTAGWHAVESRIQRRFAHIAARIAGQWSGSTLVGIASGVVAAVVLADAGLRIRRIAQAPINVTQGDMLPLLQAAV